MSLEDLSQDAINELAALARQLAENPSTRKDFLRLTKKAKPDMPIPELDLEDNTSSALQRMEERAMGLENKLREKDAVEELERRRKQLLKEGKISREEDIMEVEKIMLEKGITSHETAADYFQWMKETAKPTPSTFNRNVMNESANSVLKNYWKNPISAAREEASKALTEIRRNPKPIGL